MHGRAGFGPSARPGCFAPAVSRLQIARMAENSNQAVQVAVQTATALHSAATDLNGSIARFRNAAPTA